MRPAIERLRLVGDLACAPPGVALEFPTVCVTSDSGTVGSDPIIDGRAWADGSSFRAFDETVEHGSTNGIAIAGSSGPPVACEILTRFQRFVDRRNGWSRTPVFDEVLAEHRALHDLSKPLVKADFDHAVDTWQWLLRLSPSASLPVQLAALFHDIERLESEPDTRIEQHALDYQAFEDRHAKIGASRAYDVLRRAGVSEADARRACAIVASHERRGADVEADLLNDADALSFFSLSSAGYVDWFGPTQAKKKIVYALGRLSSAAWPRLSRIRMRNDVKALVDEVLG